MVTESEKQILKALANEYMEYASKPVQKQKINLWKALNRNKMQRPMITIDQLPWNELMCDELTVKVSDPYWQVIESGLRQTLYKWKNFPVDMVLDPFLRIPKAVYSTGFELLPKGEVLNSDTTAPARHFDNQLQTLEDVEKIKDIKIIYDTEATKQIEQQAHDIFDGIVPIKMTGNMTWHLGVWDYVSMLMGVENVYMELIDNPELVHAIMTRITDSTIAGIKQTNELMVNDDIINLCHCSHIYTDELLPDSGEGKGPLSKNCWAFGLAQLFTSVSPQTFEEFEMPYITKMAEYFGMIYYGCCDRLDDRLDIVKKIPNVKKVSCSPWSDRQAFAEKIGGDLIMSLKPNPAFLAPDTFDEDIIRKDLKQACELAKANNANLEILLKDVSTVNNNPNRLTRWADIAMDVVENY